MLYNIFDVLFRKKMQEATPMEFENKWIEEAVKKVLDIQPENELTAVRMILTGRLAGVPADSIRERLRDLYT